MLPGRAETLSCGGQPGLGNVFGGTENFSKQLSAWGVDAKVASADKPTGCCRSLSSRFLAKTCAVPACRRNVAAKRCSDPGSHSSCVAGAPTVRGSHAARLGGFPDVKWGFSQRVPLMSIKILLIFWQRYNDANFPAFGCRWGPPAWRVLLPPETLTPRRYV